MIFTAVSFSISQNGANSEQYLAKYQRYLTLGIPEYFAHQAANSRRKYWYVSGMGAVNRALTKERLINSGFYDLATAYQSVHVNY